MLEFLVGVATGCILALFMIGWQLKLIQNDEHQEQLRRFAEAVVRCWCQNDETSSMPVCIFCGSIDPCSGTIERCDHDAGCIALEARQFLENCE
jgi:hypothetical protein